MFKKIWFILLDLTHRYFAWPLNLATMLFALRRKNTTLAILALINGFFGPMILHNKKETFNIYDLSSHQRHFSLKWMNFNQVLQTENVMSITFGIRKTGPQWKTHFENSSCCKTYLENSSENCLTDFFGKTMISADVSQSLSIVSQCHCRGWDDNPKPISLIFFILLINSMIGHEDQQSPHTPLPSNF